MTNEDGESPKAEGYLPLRILWMAETLRTDFIRWLCLIRPQAGWPLLRGATCDLDKLQLSLLKMKWPR